MLTDLSLSLAASIGDLNLFMTADELSTGMTQLSVIGNTQVPYLPDFSLRFAECSGDLNLFMTADELSTG